MSGQHARLSPSGSKRWFACPGSLTLEAGFPDKHNDYSDDGTAMHDIAADCLTSDKRAAEFVGEQIKVSHEDEEARYVEIDEEMAELVQEYVDTVRAMFKGQVLHVEQRVEFSEFVGLPDQFGTGDVITLDMEQGELGAVDLKTGHRPVAVEGNTQLMFYALGALKKLAEGGYDDEDRLW